MVTISELTDEEVNKALVGIQRDIDILKNKQEPSLGASSKGQDIKIKILGGASYGT